MENLLDAAETALLLNLTPDTVRLWAQRGRLPHVRLGNTIRFRSEDLESWLTENSRPGNQK